MVGDDVAGVGRSGANQGVGHFVGAGITGSGDDRACQGPGRLVDGDTG